MLLYEKSVIKFIIMLDKNISKRIFEKTKLLKENPFPSDSKRILNINDKVFRIRVGDFRVLYRVNKNSK
jgi:mRNA interferase RelE/StbE